MRHKPTGTYNGLTIILAEPSRFDEKELLSGFAGQTFETFLSPLARQDCDIRLASCDEPYLEGTKVIYCLGERAITLFSPNSGLKPGRHLDNLRGTPLKHGNIIVIASFAPQDAFDRRDYSKDEDEKENDNEEAGEKGHQKTKRKNWRWWLLNDTRKAVRLLRNGVHKEPECKYVYTPDADTVVSLLSNAKGQQLFIDIETDRQQNLTCFGVCLRSGTADENRSVYIVPWKRYYGKLNYTPEDSRRIIQSLSSAFNSNLVISHNGMFDWFVLAYKYKIPFPHHCFDTMVAWHRCYPEIEKSLGHLISYFTDASYHKSDGVFDPKSSQQELGLWTYNGKDVSRMVELYDKLQPEILKLKASESVAQANRSIRPYLTMMFKGLKIDTEKFIQKFDECERRSFQLERCLKIITRRNLNPRSSQQVSKYLYVDQGLPCPEPEEPTNEKTLLKVLIKKPLPSIKIILAVRGEKKLASSLKFRLWNNKVDGNSSNFNRVTTSYSVAGPDTFRLASKALLKFRPDPGFGTNIQNWDKKKRYLIVPDEGKILGQTDQAGADAVFVAYGCVRRGRYRSLFENKIKPHVYVAMQIFKKDWAALLDVHEDDFCRLTIPDLAKYKYWPELSKAIKSDDIKYYIGKKTGHSFNYDQGPNTFQATVIKETEGLLVLPLADCKDYRHQYKHVLFPEIAEWHLEVQDTLKTTRKLLNAFGYPRGFYGPFGDDLWRIGYAWYPQSSVGTINNIAATELQEGLEDGSLPLLREAHFDLLQNGHDSLLWQSDIGSEREVAKIVASKLEKSFVAKDGTPFKMGSETGVGYNWQPFDEKKNPLGLKEIKL
jgi:hypothetical protein